MYAKLLTWHYKTTWLSWFIVIRQVYKVQIGYNNVRRLLHILDGAQNLHFSAAVLSFDVMKAFDLLEWPFL